MIKGKIKCILWFVFIGFWYVYSQEYFALAILIMSIIGVVVLGITTWISKGRVNIGISTQELVGKNDISFCKILIENTSRLLIPRAECCLEIENITTGERKTEIVKFSILGKRKDEIIYYLKSKYCGSIRIRVNKLIYYDCFGIFSRKEDVSEEEELIVTPNIFSCNCEIGLSVIEDYESVMYSQTQKGNDPGETFGVREYVQGDSLKSIHWKLSSKYDNTIVKELGLPVENSILIMLDASLTNSYQNRWVAIDSMMEAFVSVTENILEKQASCTIAWYDYMKEMIVSYEVNSTDEFLQMLSGVLKVKRMKDNVSVIDRLYQEHMIDKFAHILVLTHNNSLNHRLIENNEHIKILMYSENGKEDTNTVITFSNKNMEHKLCNFTI